MFTHVTRTKMVQLHIIISLHTLQMNGLSVAERDLNYPNRTKNPSTLLKRELSSFPAGFDGNKQKKDNNSTARLPK